MTRKARYAILGSLGVVLGLLACKWWLFPADSTRHHVARPVLSSTLDEAPAEVREFLDRVMEKLPEGGGGVSGYQFHHWKREGKPTEEAVGVKAGDGIDPDQLIARVMDVDKYRGNIAHVETCRAEQDPAFARPEKVRFFQVIRVPQVARVQQDLALVDAGTIKGYRVVYWYLLKDKALDPKTAARSDYNIGAWFAAPGAVGYALSSWPKREDVNAIQWVSLTSGANALAKGIVEGNIDGMAKWARDSGQIASKSH